MGNRNTELSPLYIPPTEVFVTPETREKFREAADKWADELGDLHTAMKRNDESKSAGRFGELVFTEVFGGEIQDDYEYDIEYLDMKVEVKTAIRTVAPKPHYNANISDYSMGQDCDVYYFMSVLMGDVDEPYSKIWLCGYITPDEYKEKATFHKEGDVDPESPSGYSFKFKADCYTLKYRELKRRDIEGSLEI